MADSRNGQPHSASAKDDTNSHHSASLASSSPTIHHHSTSSSRGQTDPPRRPNGPQQAPSAASVDSARTFAGDAAETYQEARHAFEQGRPSPYFTAVVALLCSLSQGLPLASMFKVYTFLTCEAYDGINDDNSVLASKESHTPFSAALVSTLSGGIDALGIKLPPAPELPHPPQCSSPEVQKTTSAYAASMATVGALVSLVLLDKVTKISRHFGRKPIMLLSQLLIALAFCGFRLSVALPQYVGMGLLFVAVVILEASAGAPLRISLQNYVVDTTTDSQRAAALSFIEGFGQLGAFPSSTIGGFLAAVTGEFFAPFYASIAVALFTFVFVLILVPESKRHRRHTVIDDWEHSAEAEERHAEQNRRREARRRESYQSSAPGDDSYVSTDTDMSTTSTRRGWKHYLRKINFLSPLAIFLPKRHTAGPRRGRLDLRLLNLAAIVVFEETFQVFLVPTLLLYNSDVFGFDVLQNGYLVSLLQGTRALYLTVIFPPAVAAARRWVTFQVKQRREKRERRSNGRQPRGEPNEATPLLNEDQAAGQRISSTGDGSSSTYDSSSRSVDNQPQNGSNAGGESTSGFSSTAAAATKEEERGKLDISLMIASYTLATASFLLLALSRTLSSGSNTSGPWILLGIAIIGTQLSSGATNLRTALIVNSVSTPSSQRPEGSGTDADPQSKALAASQSLCTLVYALVPLLTSAVYGLGLSKGIPEIVWAFKAIFAALATLASVGLLITHRGDAANGVGNGDRRN